MDANKNFLDHDTLIANGFHHKLVSGSPTENSYSKYVLRQGSSWDIQICYFGKIATKDWSILISNNRSESPITIRSWRDQMTVGKMQSLLDAAEINHKIK